MDNSQFIYVIIYTTMNILMIIISYIIFLNFYDETIIKYINHASKKIINFINIFDKDNNEILKKMYNEINFINIKLIDIINNNASIKKKKNNEIIKNTYDFPYLIILLILLLLVSIMIIVLYNNKYCIKNLSVVNILINIFISSFISIIFLSLIQYFFLFYMLRNVVKINIKDIFINVLNKLKEKSKEIQN